MSQEDDRNTTRRRAKDAPQPTTSRHAGLPGGRTLQRAADEVESAVEPERPVLDSEALLAELNSIDPDELARLLSDGAPRRFRTGDKVSGEVVRLRGDTAFIDIGAKSEAMMSITDLEEPPKRGEIIEAFVLRADGRGIQVSQQLGGRDADLDALEEAMSAGVPVEGRVTAHNSGGFTVRVGQVSAFCPRSQIDYIIPETLDAYVGQTYTFKIIDIEGSKVVISRRTLLEAEREEAAAKLWETIAPGDAMDGVVANVRDFGVFVDLGGVQGLASKRDLSWDPDQPTTFKRGDSVRVRILEVDRARKRIALSLKDEAFSPWNGVGTNFVEGAIYSATVTRLTEFGAFLKLAPGLEGLCHISNIASTRTENPADVLSVGDVVQVRVLNIDHERKRIGLGIKQANDANYVHEPAPPPPPRSPPASLGTMADLFGNISLQNKPERASTKRPASNKKKRKKRR